MTRELSIAWRGCDLFRTDQIKANAISALAIAQKFKSDLDDMYDDALRSALDDATESVTERLIDVLMAIRKFEADDEICPMCGAKTGGGICDECAGEGGAK